MKFLIVDDNPNFRKYLLRQIPKEKSIIKELDDGEKVVETYLDFKPDWVLMDIQMKRVNGLDAAIQIKQVDHSAKIVIISNYNDQKFKNKAAEVGATAFIHKENLLDLNTILSRGIGS